MLQDVQVADAIEDAEDSRRLTPTTVLDLLVRLRPTDRPVNER